MLTARLYIASFAALGLLVVVAAHARPDGKPPSGGGVSVEPDHIGIDLLYGGAAPRVHATVPARYQVAVRLMGKSEHLELKKRGKVWGVLWMNVGELALQHVPVAYLLATSAPLGKLASADELNRLDLGYRALARRAGPDAEEFGELIKLKEGEGLYRVREGDVRLAPSTGEAASLDVSFSLPARTPTGEYTADVFGFEHGHGYRLGTATLRLEQVGLVRTLHSLAMERSLLYGLAAVLAAIVAGVLTGLVFGRQPGKPH